MNNTIHMRFVKNGKITGYGKVGIELQKNFSTGKPEPWASFKCGEKGFTSWHYPADTIELGIERPDGEVWYEGDVIECNDDPDIRIGTIGTTQDEGFMVVDKDGEGICYLSDATFFLRRIGNIHEKDN